MDERSLLHSLTSNMNLYTALSRIRLLVILKQSIDRVELSLFRLRQRIMRTVRLWGVVQSKKNQSYTFAILCVKRVEYLTLAIDNINSLHYYNPTHSFVLYMDDTCFRQFKKMSHLLHYPTNVSATRFVNNPKQAWTLSKVDVLIKASLRNQILTDADGIWRSDICINREKILFLVKVGAFSKNRSEKMLLEKVLKKPEWCVFTHYVTGFVSIPKKFMTKRLIQDCREITADILTKKFPSMLQGEAQSLRRLAEEIGVCLAVQKNYPRSTIMTLKTTDGPGSREMLQSLYYGCSNKIIN